MPTRIKTTRSASWTAARSGPVNIHSPAGGSASGPVRFGDGIGGDAMAHHRAQEEMFASDKMRALAEGQYQR